MAYTNNTYYAISDLFLWFKIQNGERLVLSDVPKIIPLRWKYFTENWHIIKKQLLEKSYTYEQGDALRKNIDKFSDFIEIQRYIKSNPLMNSNTLFKFQPVFNNIEIQSIPLSKKEEQAIQDRVSVVQRYSKNDFINIRRTLINERDLMADKVSLYDETYNDVYSRSSVPGQVSITPDKIVEMAVIQANIGVCDFVLANINTLNTMYVDPFALAKTNANNNTVNINTYKAGRLVRFNYGESLQSIAQKYLGSADKWIELAIANALKPPYIDEEGVRIDFVTNGKDNVVYVSGTNNGLPTASFLYINQVVFLQSKTLPFPETRHIINITKIPVSGDIIIELDGDQDLSKYTVSDESYVRVFKPGTINSGFFILIPNNENIPESDKNVPWFLQTSSEDEKNSKIDLLITDNNDLTFSSNGDLCLSYGVSNAIQAVKLFMQTERGELGRHKRYGFVPIQGSQNDDPDNIRTKITESIVSSIDADIRFDSLEKIQISHDINKYNISIIVKLAGSLQPVPITFTVNAP